MSEELIGNSPIEAAEPASESAKAKVQNSPGRVEMTNPKKIV